MKKLAKKALGISLLTAKRHYFLRRLYHLVYLRNKIRRYPSGVILEPTTRCNSKCVYCARTEMVKQGTLKPSDMPLSTLRKSLEEIYEINPYVEQISLAGLGEPTLYPHLADACRLVKSLFAKTSLDLITNGIILDKKTSLFLRYLDTIKISVNSHSNEAYRILNGTNYYKQVVSNTQNFLTEKGAGKPLALIQLLLTDINKSYVNEFLDYWSSYLGPEDSVTLMPLQNAGGSIDRDSLAEALHVSPQPCVQLWKSLYVGTTGDIYACCMGTIKGVGSEIWLGNINECSLKQILENGRLSWLRKMHLFNRQKDVKACRNCDFWKLMVYLPFIKVAGRWV